MVSVARRHMVTIRCRWNCCKNVITSHSKLWYIITHPCPIYPLLAPKSSLLVSRSHWSKRWDCMEIPKKFLWRSRHINWNTTRSPINKIAMVLIWYQETRHSLASFKQLFENGDNVLRAWTWLEQTICKWCFIYIYICIYILCSWCHQAFGEMAMFFL